MPILEVPKSNAPLSQGDILKGLTLYITGSGWSIAEETAERRSADLSLVISRSCAVTHKPQIVVAAVTLRAESPPKNIGSFDEVLEFLESLKMGDRAPDRFYLGQVPSEANGRYYAELDSLHTVTLPPRDELPRCLNNHRIATLSPDFVRHLHLRIFSSFAMQGFDDYSWFSDSDLEWLVGHGESGVTDAKSQLTTAEAKMRGHKAGGDDGKALKIEAEVVRLGKTVKALEAQMAPYVEEHHRRCKGDTNT